MLTKSELLLIIKIIRSLPKIEEQWAVYCKAVGLVLRPWQERVVNDFFKHREVVWNFCRGAGKTFLMSHLFVFMYFSGMVIDPFWIAASWSQLNRAQMYWHSNPFIKSFSPSKHRDRITVINGKVLLFTGATDDNVNGPRGECVLYDEVARFEEIDLWNSMPIADHVSDPYRLFSSTPIAESVFHKLTNIYPTYTQTYLDCPEMNHAAILARKKTMPEWLWLMNYMCVFTIPEGVVFPYITETTNINLSGLKIRQGVDFGITPGHTLVKIGITKGKVYILSEATYKYKTEHAELKTQCHLFPTEVESGGFNEAFAPYFKGRNITQAPFVNNTLSNTKYERISWMLEREIIINPTECPKTLSDMKKARWEMVGKGLRPTVETGPLHHLAALIHAAGATESLVDIGQPQRRQRLNMRHVRQVRNSL